MMTNWEAWRTQMEPDYQFDRQDFLRMVGLGMLSLGLNNKQPQNEYPERNYPQLPIAKEQLVQVHPESLFVDFRDDIDNEAQLQRLLDEKYKAFWEIAVSFGLEYLFDRKKAMSDMLTDPEFAPTVMARGFLESNWDHGRFTRQVMLREMSRFGLTTEPPVEPLQTKIDKLQTMMDGERNPMMFAHVSGERIVRAARRYRHSILNLSLMVGMSGFKVLVSEWLKSKKKEQDLKVYKYEAYGGIDQYYALESFYNVCARLSGTLVIGAAGNFNCNYRQVKRQFNGDEVRNGMLVGVIWDNNKVTDDGADVYVPSSQLPDIPRASTSAAAATVSGVAEVMRQIGVRAEDVKEVLISRFTQEVMMVNSEGESVRGRLLNRAGYTSWLNDEVKRVGWI